MALAANAHSQNAGKHRIEIPASTTGEFVFPVGLGKRVSITVGNPGGSTFNLIHYNFSEEDDTADGVTRVKAIDDLDVTIDNYANGSLVGFAQVGIEITTATASPVVLEVVQIKF